MYEWRANSPDPHDRSGRAALRIPGAPPATMVIELSDSAQFYQLTALLDAAYGAGRNDERKEWVQSLRTLVAQRGREE